MIIILWVCVALVGCTPAYRPANGEVETAVRQAVHTYSKVPVRADTFKWEAYPDSDKSSGRISVRGFCSLQTDLYEREAQREILRRALIEAGVPEWETDFALWHSSHDPPFFAKRTATSGDSRPFTLELRYSKTIDRAQFAITDLEIPHWKGQTAADFEPDVWDVSEARSRAFFARIAASRESIINAREPLSREIDTFFENEKWFLLSQSDDKKTLIPTCQVTISNIGEWREPEKGKSNPGYPLKSLKKIREMVTEAKLLRDASVNNEIYKRGETDHFQLVVDVFWNHQDDEWECLVYVHTKSRDDSESGFYYSDDPMQWNGTNFTGHFAFVGGVAASLEKGSRTSTDRDHH